LVFGFEALVTKALMLFYHDDGDTNGSVWEGLSGFSVLLFHGRNTGPAPRLYTAVALIGAYMLTFFVLFVVHDTKSQPYQTTWLTVDTLTKYNFENNQNNAPGGDVTGSASAGLRATPFEWPRTLQRQAVFVNGSIGGAGPSGGALVCDGTAGFDCYASRHALFTPPSGTDLPSPAYVPFAGRFYTADVIISPPPGAACKAIEAYRLLLDDRKNVARGLDYPASVAQANANNNRKCSLFGVGAWCLQFQHPFADADYAEQVADKCTAAGGGKLVIRLPEWVEHDVSPITARAGLDVLLVTAGSSVQMRWTWRDQDQKERPLLGVWEQWHTTVDDDAQAWRDASDQTSVFFKYAIVVTPLLMVWYYLAVVFEDLVEDHQVLMTCLFVLLPSTLVFLSVGAWLPMAGSIVCIVAIAHSPVTPEAAALKPAWMLRGSLRHILLFLTAVCNSIQLVWILVLVAQAGASAFLYENTLTQLRDLTKNAIIDGVPAWIGLVLPSSVAINVTFLLGAAICVAFELLSTNAYVAAGAPAAPASA
jgi:hypothetical protein